MPRRTYTLDVEEADTGAGITADVYNDEGTIEESVWVEYAAHGLVADRDEGTPPARTQEVVADVTTTDLQVERDGSAFEFRLLGDREELLVERITDGDWRLGSVEE